MKNKLFAFFLIIIAVSVTTVFAFTDDPYEVIDVTLTGGAHGTTVVEPFHTELAEAESGYLGRIDVLADPGYYVSEVSATFNSQPLQLGFEAGAETGNFFRNYQYSPLRDLYNFIIPNDASVSNKVQVSITYTEKTPFNISYSTYTGNTYTDDAIINLDSYEGNHLLVENYKDGDLVLPDECTNNGCLLKLEFASEADYNEYKNAPQREQNDRWLVGEAVNLETNQNYFLTGPEACNEETHVCNVFINKEFKDFSYGFLRVGYTELNIFSTKFIGFRASTEIENFNDSVQNSIIGFNEDKMEDSIEIFYGTKYIYLQKKTPRALVQTPNSEAHLGSIRDFNNVTGNGFGYSTSYEYGDVVVSINSYYQDQLTLELNLMDGNTNVLGDSVQLHLDRFAFIGNGMSLLPVDQEGRNCFENNNGNTCSDGVYYSVQYRGILKSFYTNDNHQREQITSFYRYNGINGNTVELGPGDAEYAYARNQSFDPHVIALFYNDLDMIVETRIFDLNEEIDMDGFVSKNTFNSLYGNYSTSVNLNKNYVYFQYPDTLPIKYLDYFGGNLDETIMHQIVVLSEEEAEDKEVYKVAFFLVDGEIDPTSLPALNYGVGEGKVLLIPGGDE